MEQGRRATRHAFSGELHFRSTLIPVDIFTIPEMATVGLMEQQFTEKHGAAMVGNVNFGRLARAYIMAASSGVLKLVADPTGHKLLGINYWAYRLSVMVPRSWYSVGKWRFLTTCSLTRLPQRFSTSRRWRKVTVWRPWTSFTVETLTLR